MQFFLGANPAIRCNLFAISLRCIENFPPLRYRKFKKDFHYYRG